VSVAVALLLVPGPSITSVWKHIFSTADQKLRIYIARIRGLNGYEYRPQTMWFLTGVGNFLSALLMTGEAFSMTKDCTGLEYRIGISIDLVRGEEARCINREGLGLFAREGLRGIFRSVPVCEEMPTQTIRVCCPSCALVLSTFGTFAFPKP
jgi:hypothetical protein